MRQRLWPAFLPVIMEKLAQKRVYGVVCEENIPSQRVLEKCGFKMIQQGLGLYQGETKRVKTYVFEKAGAVNTRFLSLRKDGERRNVSV